jgi:hypothetical protein
MSLWDRLERLDARIIYILILIVLIIPLARPLGLPLKVSPLTKDAHQIIDELPAGSKVLYHTCIYPGCMGEMEPVVTATIKHLLRNDIKIYFIDLQASGVGIMNMLPPLLEKIPEYKNAVYDEDYLMLGFYAGGEATFKNIGADVKSIVTVDLRGNPTDTLKMMDDIKTVSDFDLILNTGECNPGVMFQWSLPYKVKTVMACLMMGLAPDIMPQYEAGVIQGVLAGLRSGAEYEYLIRSPGVGIAGIDAISTSHLTIIILLVIGNLGMVLKKLIGEKT